MAFPPDFRLRQFPIILILFFTALGTNGQSQDFLGLKNIISGSYLVAGHTPDQGVEPSVIEADASGGTIEAAINFKTGAEQYCTGLYRFEWAFSEPVTRLTKGQQIEIFYQATLLNSPCNSARAKMIPTVATGASPSFKQTGVGATRGLTIRNGSWLQAAATTANHTAILSVINTAGPATLKFNFESTGLLGSDRLHFEVVYLFENGYESKPECDSDLICSNLFSVGVLVGFVEYGASKDDNPQFLAEQLAGAIVHAEASKCVPTDGLQQMMDKLKSAASSRPLHQEIGALRHQIAKYVEQHCNCCK